MAKTQRERELERRRLEMRMSAIGIQFGISVVIGAVFGWFLDQRFGTGPWLLLVGVTLGAAAAYRDLWDLNRRLRQTSESGE
ncbi:MAG: AtpZ/AtpI family protein [Deltaproteobacteria bacterium]|nr:MAG: AtpZ/AtpI family protein [Deltaproteobacteria bacterium]